jgi:prepilin-type N-terminal cleavage/methylation domain-containing protein
MALNKKGFTLVEMMVVFAIIGILAATAIPAYNVIRQKIYGSEAKVMLSQIINAQIAYYLENNRYYGEEGISPLCVYHDGEEPVDAQNKIYKNLNLEIPKGHFVDYSLYTGPNGENFTLILTSNHKAGFDLFNGASQVIARLDDKGHVEIDYPPSE